MRTATNPDTGEKVVEYKGKWVSLAETATNQETGQKAYKIGSRWITEPVEKPETRTPLEDPTNWRDYSPVLGKDNPLSLRNTAAPMMEAGLAMGSSGLAASKGGWDAVNAYLKNELIGKGVMEGEITDPKQMTANAVQRYGYQPKSKGAQSIVNAISTPLQAYAEKGTEMADRAQKATGSKLYGAGTEAMWHALPAVLGAKNPKSPYVAQKGNPVVDAIMNRMPGGTKRAAGEVVTETAGPRLRSVRDELIAADKKLTAGQATTPAGSYETSALFKMVEDRDPSSYGAIRKGQEAGRIDRLRAEAKSPETQQYMKNIQGGVSNKLYDAGRKGAIPEASVKVVLDKVDSLIEKNVGNSKFVAELRKARKGLAGTEGIRTDAQTVLSTVDGLRIALKQPDYGPIKGQLNSLKKEISGLSEKYKQGDKFFAETSRPLTQMGIFQELIDTLAPKLGSREKATQYVNAITGRGQALTQKKAAGGKKPIKGEFKAALKPEQENLIVRIGEELDNNAVYSEQAQIGKAKMNDLVGTMWDSPKFRVLSRPMVIINTIMKRIEGRSSAATLDELAQLGKPENRAKLIKIIDEALPEELAILQQSSLRLGRLAPGAVAGSAGEQ